MRTSTREVLEDLIAALAFQSIDEQESKQVFTTNDFARRQG